MDGEITTTTYVNFCTPCIQCKHNILHTVYLIRSLIHLNSYSGGMTRPQPPTCCCCQRSRGANLSACALNQQSVRTHALHSTRDSRSDSGPQFPKGFVLFLSYFCLVCFLPFLIFAFAFRLGTPFTSARMKTLWLWVLWTFAQATLMIARGFQSQNIHPRGSEVSQMEPQTKTRYVKVGTNVCFCCLPCPYRQYGLKTLSLVSLSVMWLTLVFQRSLLTPHLSLLCIPKETGISFSGEKVCLQPDPREGANDDTAPPGEKGQRPRTSQWEQGE